ncbi:MAG: IPExxxVDY family protein [Ferruginibacter sp.]
MSSIKFKLDNDQLADAFFEDTLLMGIVAPMKDYQFSWHLNKMLGFDFRINNSLEIPKINKKRKYFFNVFEYNIETMGMTHYLYNNQFDGDYLLPELKHLDFLWLIKDAQLSTQELNELMQSIRSVPGVQLVNEMTPDKIINKQFLIF